jgi:hypothetical protein
MLKKVIFTVAFIACFINVYAQHRGRCSSDGYLKALQKRFPFLKDTVNNYNSRPQSPTGDEIIYIPVVVHIIHNGLSSVTNISDEQVFSQINILNQTYFAIQGNSGLGVDTKIRFCLAKRDPIGNPSTGITREVGPLSYYVPFDTLGNILNDDEIKSCSPWPFDKYLNIWVCDLRDQDPIEDMYGYSTPPWVGGIYDGVVIGYKYFGNIGTGLTNPNINEGKTTTHEVGHWLGLWHTFKDSEFSGYICRNNNCKIDGDQVCDTDPVPCPAWSEPGFNDMQCLQRKNCNGKVISAGNYMDYNNDRCLSFFTAGQKVRIHEMLRSYRNFLYYTSIVYPSTLPVACTPQGTDIPPSGGFTCKTRLDYTKGFFINGHIEPKVKICGTESIILNFSHNDSCVYIPRCWQYIDCSTDPNASLWQKMFGHNCGEDQWRYYISILYNCDENYNCASEVGKWFTTSTSGSNNLYNNSLSIGTSFNFTFERGKYYQIKLASDYNCSDVEGWRDQLKQIYIQPEDQLFFNNSTIPSGTYAAKHITIQNSTVPIYNQVKMVSETEIEIFKETSLNSNFYAYIAPVWNCNPQRVGIAWENSTEGERLNYDSTEKENYDKEKNSNTLKTEANLTITPNPTNGVFVVTIMNSSETIGFQELKVFDTFGKIIWSSNALPDNTVSVDITWYPAGVYFLRSINKLGGIEIKKLIKQ